MFTESHIIVRILIIYEHSRAQVLSFMVANRLCWSSIVARLCRH